MNIYIKKKLLQIFVIFYIFLFQRLDGNELLLSKSTIDNMFENDMTFAAKENVDVKDLR